MKELENILNDNYRLMEERNNNKNNIVDMAESQLTEQNENGNENGSNVGVEIAEISCKLCKLFNKFFLFGLFFFRNIK